QRYRRGHGVIRRVIRQLREVLRHLLDQRHESWTNRQIGPHIVRRRGQQQHASFAGFAFDDCWIAAGESRDYGARVRGDFEVSEESRLCESRCRASLEWREYSMVALKIANGDELLSVALDIDLVAAGCRH